MKLRSNPASFMKKYHSFFVKILPRKKLSHYLQNTQPKLEQLHCKTFRIVDYFHIHPLVVEFIRNSQHVIRFYTLQTTSFSRPGDEISQSHKISYHKTVYSHHLLFMLRFDPFSHPCSCRISHMLCVQEWIDNEIWCPQDLCKNSLRPT